MTHIRVCKFSIIGSDNGLSPGRCQAIIRTNVEILLILPPGTYSSEILIEIHISAFKKIHLRCHFVTASTCSNIFSVISSGFFDNRQKEVQIFFLFLTIIDAYCFVKTHLGNLQCIQRLRMSNSIKIAIVNTLRPRQIGRHFPDDTFKRIFLNGNVSISIKISMKFVPNKFVSTKS